MDLYVERQCVEQIKKGNTKQFLLLFDASFQDLFKYVARRGGSGEDVENTVRLVFLDALGQIQNTPQDVSYSVWLYSLAKPRVWDQISKASFPEKQGLISATPDGNSDAGVEDLVARTEKIMKKLSLEEREILRLKFFEEVADGDVMTILGMEEGTIGSKIYRVLKRAHFLLFGEGDERQGVYFGELSGFFSRTREVEKITIPEVFKLSLRADLSGRIERREFAVDADPVEEMGPKEPPVKIISEEFIGSSDPAKVFVEAVKEMRAEEELQRVRDQLKLEREEKVFDFFERRKKTLVVIPSVIFVGLLAFFLVKAFDVSLFEEEGIERGYPTECSIDVEFKGEFSYEEKISVNLGISDRICSNFDVKKLVIARQGDDKVKVNVDVLDGLLEYKFVRETDDWKIKEYVRINSSDEKSGQVQRSRGGFVPSLDRASRT